MSKNQGKKCQKHRKIFKNVKKPEKNDSKISENFQEHRKS